jgi:hypothetical protein
MSMRKAFHLITVINLVFCTSFVPLAGKFELISKPASPATTIRIVCSACAYTSIQAAIDDSIAGDIVALTAQTFTEPITIDKDITLQGQGPGSTIIQAAANKNDATERVVTVVVTATATIADLKIRYGNTTGGGGIHNRGTLTVTNSIITNNLAANNGAGIFNTGKSSGEHAVLTIIDSVISNNDGEGSGKGGGIYNYAQDGDATVNLIRTEIHGNYNSYGGGISNFAESGTATLNLMQTQVYGNSGAMKGGGIENRTYSASSKAILSIQDSTIDDNTILYDGGGIYNFSESGETSVELTNSTISNNRAYDFGGGIYNNAFDGSCEITLTNVTISANHADQGAGVYNYGYGSPANVTIIASTINGNIAASYYSGGIYNDRNTGNVNSSATITMTGSIVANNVDYDCDNIVARGAVFINAGYNIIETGGGDCGTTGDGDPMIGPLQDNGGPTFTNALLEGSQAIDAVPFSACLVFTDQRGVKRPLGYGCDIGAYEFEEYIIFLSSIFK